MTKNQDANRSFKLSLAALVVSALLGFGNFGFQIYRDTRNKASSEARFGKIETALRLLTGAVAPQLQKAVDDSLMSALSGDPNKSKDQIDFAKAAIYQLRESKTSLTSDAVAATGRQVEKVADARYDLPETWSVVGEFITYRSQMLNGWQETNLPLCTNKSPVARFDFVHGSKIVNHGPFTYSHCKIVLDSPGATVALSRDLSLANVVLDHCAIFYNGGPIVLFPVKVAIETPATLVGSISFNDCVFNLSLPAVPPRNGQQLARALLTANFNSVQVQFGQEG